METLRWAFRHHRRRGHWPQTFWYAGIPMCQFCDHPSGTPSRRGLELVAVPVPT